MSVLLGTLHTFSKLIFRFLPHFQEIIVFLSQQLPKPQLCKDMERNVAHFNVESVNYLDIEVHIVSNRPCWFPTLLYQSLFKGLTLQQAQKMYIEF